MPSERRIVLGAISFVAVVLVIIAAINFASGITWNIAVTADDGAGTVKTEAPVTGDGSEGDKVTIAPNGITHNYLAEHAVEPTNMDGYTSDAKAGCVVTAVSTSAFGCIEGVAANPGSATRHLTTISIGGVAYDIEASQVVGGAVQSVAGIDGLVASGTGTGAARTGDVQVGLTGAYKGKIDGLPQHAQAQIFEAAYASNISGNANNLLNGTFLGLDASSSKIGGNTGWDDGNLRFLVLDDVKSYFNPNSKTGDSDWNKNFIDTDGNIRSLLDLIQVHGSLVLSNAPLAGTNPDMFLPATRAGACLITSIGSAGDSRKIGVDCRFMGSGTLSNGRNLVVLINPNTETIDWRNVKGAPELVERTDLEGNESDLFASWQPASAFLTSGTTYRSGAWGLASNTTGAPTAADDVRENAIAAGAGTIFFGRLRTDSDGDASYTLGPALSAADYPSGTILHISNWDPYDPDNHIRVTWSSDSTLVGTGDAAYLWATVSIAEVGDVGGWGASHGGYYRLSSEVPSGLDVDLPYTAIGNAPWVRTDGSNVTPELVEAIQGSNEDEDLGTFTRVALGQEQSGDNRFGVGGALVFSVAEDANYQSATSDTNDAKLWRAAKERAWVRFGNGWEIEIVSLSARYIGTGRAQYSIGTWNVIAGTAPGLNSTTSVTIIGEDVHRGQLDDIAFTGLQRHGTALPSTCTVGLVFLLTQASGGNTAGLYACLASNTWTKVGP